MEEAIRNFNKQFAWKVVVENVEKLPRTETYILDGMGGSPLSAELIKLVRPTLDLSVCKDYGLPELPKRRFSGALCIADSYSGNTEEAIDFATEALAKGFPLAVIAKGGKLIELARTHSIPHIVLPLDKIQPRSGLGYQMIALATLLDDRTLLTELRALSSVLKPDELREEGKRLAGELRGKVPVIYASTRNRAVAYNWKIKLNETGKIPAFYNVFPELNHNEMTGFDATSTTEGLSRKFHFIFLTDRDDHSQIQKRMQVTRKLYADRGLPVTEVALEGKTELEKVFSSLLIADWTALYLSQVYGTEPEQVPMVEEFKKLIVG